jgi:hypothetical protein
MRFYFVTSHPCPLTLPNLPWRGEALLPAVVVFAKVGAKPASTLELSHFSTLELPQSPTAQYAKPPPRHGS